ncbi:MAG TPA: hypothetical protein VII56_16940 [Rhizomicrobium sp.]
MFGSQILDIAIAMIMFYLFISLICSAVREGIEALTKVRAMNIERGIRELLNDPNGNTITQHLFDHPLLAGLFQGDYNPAALVKAAGGKANAVVKNMGIRSRNDLPSYIPASNFAIALLDITAKRACAAAPPVSPLQAPPLNLNTVRDAIATLPNAQIQSAVLSAVERANGDLAQAQKNLEDWFNSAMDRVSGWYKRRTQIILFALGFVAAVLLNMDTFAVLHAVSGDQDLRNKMLAIAQAANTDADKDKASKQLIDGFQKLNLPMGWDNFRPIPQADCAKEAPAPCPDSRPDFWVRANFWNILKMILGWLITGAAVTLGAPFWFDTLSKFMSVRSALKPGDAQASPPPAPGTTAAPAAPAGAAPPEPPFSANEWISGIAQAGVI